MSSPDALATAGHVRSIVEETLNARLLIVDDEEHNVRLLLRILRWAGYSHIRATTDPMLVPSLVAEFEPDLILLDLHMPRRDGFGVLEQLAADRHAPSPRLPVLMLTGDDSAVVKRKALALGASDFVAKPLDEQEVALRIRNLIETRMLHRALGEQNARLERRVEERTRELQEAQMEVLERLAAAAELRDDDTGQHTQRVGAISARIAIALGLPTEHAELIRQAAALHDVGKIGIPDAILRKPGRLTPGEYEAMKEHTTLGARILAGGRSASLAMAERIARSHHERWDGTGYPDGRSGKDIPLEARIVAVADVMDALSHARPYRDAWPRERVTEIIRDGSGSHFDPTVVAALLGSD